MSRRGRFKLLLVAFVLLAQGCKGELPAWMQPGIREGAGILHKSLYLSLDGVGEVTDIRFGDLRFEGKREVGIAGNYGARFFDAAKTPQGKVQFATRTPEDFRVSACTVKRTATTSVLFYRHAGAAATYDSLVNSEGAELWRLPESVAGAAFGEVGARNAPEFFVTYQFGSAKGTVEARDVAGRILWRAPGLAPHNTAMALVSGGDAEGAAIVLDGGDDILKPVLIGLDLNGHTVFRNRAIERIDDFTTVVWPPRCPSECILVSRDDGFHLITADGRRRVAALPGEYLGDVRAAAVRLSPDAPAYLAIVGPLEYQGHAIVGFEAVHGALYVYDGSGRLTYHEVLPEPCEAVAAIPSDDGKAQALLVGGVDKVWEYTVAPHAGNSTTRSP